MPDQLNTPDQNDRSAYPHPNDFAVMRPEYHQQDDGFWQATINVSPFRVKGESASKPGARRAALYEAEKTYRNYHPSHSINNPFPEEFTDGEGMEWKRTSPQRRGELGDYIFEDDYGEQDYVDIETMLMWDVRPAAAAEAASEPGTDEATPDEEETASSEKAGAEVETGAEAEATSAAQ